MRQCKRRPSDGLNGAACAGSAATYLVDAARRQTSGTYTTGDGGPCAGNPRGEASPKHSCPGVDLRWLWFFLRPFPNFKFSEEPAPLALLPVPVGLDTAGHATRSAEHLHEVLSKTSVTSLGLPVAVPNTAQGGTKGSRTREIRPPEAEAG